MKRFPFPFPFIETLCYFCIALGVVVGLWRGLQRSQVETRNNHVEILLDWSEIERTATLSGKTVDEVLVAFHEAGATSVALTEDSIGELEGERQITVSTGDTPHSTNITGSPQVLARIAFWLKNRLLSSDTPALLQYEEHSLRIALPYSQVRGQTIGIDADSIQKIRAAKLQVVGRVSSIPGIDTKRAAFTLDSLSKQGIKTVIFSGDSVMGFKDLLKPISETDSVAKLMSERKISYGFVEFGKQKGDELLSKQMPEGVIRVHTITKEEMNTAGKDESIQRFLLAARERNLRILLVRFFWDDGNVFESNISYVQKIKEGIEHSKSIRLINGVARPYNHLQLALPLLVLLSLALSGAMVLLFHSLTGVLSQNANRRLQLITLISAVLPVGFALLGIIGQGIVGAKLLALLAACLFPALGLLQSDVLAPRRKQSPFAVALTRFGRATLWTIVGIICITGLLSDRLFMIKAESFMGIKASNFAPLLFCVLAYAAGIHYHPKNTQSLKQNLAQLRTKIVQIGTEPLRLWQVVLALLALSLLGMLWIRSGNDASGAVSGLELKLRGLQDRFLPARPRFKEYLIFPFLFTAFFLAAEGKTPRWVLVPLLLFGAIAEGSLLNTFCHIHTPLTVGIWRASIGLLLGLGLGILLCFILTLLRRSLDSPEKFFSANNPQEEKA